MDWTNIEATFKVKTMKLSKDEKNVWMTGDLEVPSPDRIGQPASGSDFFEMLDTTIKCKVSLLNPDLYEGDSIHVKHTGKWFVPEQWEEQKEIKLVLDCSGKCTDACPKYDGKFCTDQG